MDLIWDCFNFIQKRGSSSPLQKEEESVLHSFASPRDDRIAAVAGVIVVDDTRLLPGNLEVIVVNKEGLND